MTPRYSRRLENIRNRLENATKGPNGYRHVIDWKHLTIDEYDSSGGTIAECVRPEIADLFGHAASDLYFLLDLVEQLSRVRKPIPKKLRYGLLHKAGFRCEACGASAKHDGVKLEIDHIMPVSLGGTNAPENLRVLCWDCNNGKGNRPG